MCKALRLYQKNFFTVHCSLFIKTNRLPFPIYRLPEKGLLHKCVLHVLARFLPKIAPKPKYCMTFLPGTSIPGYQRFAPPGLIGKTFSIIKKNRAKTCVIPGIF